jgi:hypothetical protein
MTIYEEFFALIVILFLPCILWTRAQYECFRKIISFIWWELETRLPPYRRNVRTNQQIYDHLTVIFQATVLSAKKLHVKFICNVNLPCVLQYFNNYVTSLRIPKCSHGSGFEQGKWARLEWLCSAPSFFHCSLLADLSHGFEFCPYNFLS